MHTLFLEYETQIGQKKNLDNVFQSNCSSHAELLTNLRKIEKRPKIRHKAVMHPALQLIEAFVYCVLGAQVNVRSSILGDGGRAKEAQTEFLVLLEEAIRQPNLSKSVQRYQLAVDEAKVRSNLAVAPGTWLMPARMVINTGSVAGYNNQLRQATPNMKLGVNNSVNLETKKVGARLMDGEKSKIGRPTSHPSNPIHKVQKTADFSRPSAASQ